MTGGDLAAMLSKTTYNQLKGKLFTIFESQFEGQKLDALKRIIEAEISNTTAYIHSVIISNLGDFNTDDVMVLPAEPK